MSGKWVGDWIDVVLWVIIGFFVLALVMGHDTPGQSCGPGMMGGTECEWDGP